MPHPYPWARRGLDCSPVQAVTAAEISGDRDAAAPVTALLFIHSTISEMKSAERMVCCAAARGKAAWSASRQVPGPSRHEPAAPAPSHSALVTIGRGPKPISALQRIGYGVVNFLRGPLALPLRDPARVHRGVGGSGLYASGPHTSRVCLGVRRRRRSGRSLAVLAR
jgi:hypothetical protein